MDFVIDDSALATTGTTLCIVMANLATIIATLVSHSVDTNIIALATTTI